MAAAKLKLERFEEAANDCDAVLSIEEANPKALYRRATAFEAMGRVRRARADALALASAETGNRTWTRLLARLDAAVEALEADEREERHAERRAQGIDSDTDDEEAAAEAERRRAEAAAARARNTLSDDEREVIVERALRAGRKAQAAYLDAHPLPTMLDDPGVLAPSAAEEADGPAARKYAVMGDWNQRDLMAWCETSLGAALAGVEAPAVLAGIIKTLGVVDVSGDAFQITGPNASSTVDFLLSFKVTWRGVWSEAVPGAAEANRIHKAEGTIEFRGVNYEQVRLAF